MPEKRLTVISQVWVPDPTAVGQYLAECARSLAQAGWRVRVYTANRGYEDPTRRFLAREDDGGVEIRRLPFSSLGKRRIAVRTLGQMLFLAQVFVRVLFSRSAGRILVSTSPPMAGICAVLVKLLRRKAKVVWWVMDLNPDQVIAAGVAGPRHPLVRLFNWLNRRMLAASEHVIALDSYMAERLASKGSSACGIDVLPLWPLEDHLEPIAHAQNPFRQAHGLVDKFVVMYSGNHSPVHPLRTILEAAKRLRGEPRFAFVFVGGGQGKKDVLDFAAREGLGNVLCLPYQPLEQIRYSLSAADLHVVAMGENMVGIVHPSKVYSVLALGRPVLYLGPPRSHIGDILREREVGWQVGHGDVEGAVEVVRVCAGLTVAERDRMGKAGAELMRTKFSKSELLGRLCKLVGS